MTRGPKIVLAVIGATIAFFLFLLVGARDTSKKSEIDSTAAPAVPSAEAPQKQVTPLGSAHSSNQGAESDRTSPRDSSQGSIDRSAADSESSQELPKLTIPVAGVLPRTLTDTYSDARSEGRTHNAIDILASEGTPVLAAADGTVKRLFKSEKGGTTIYQLTQNKRFVLYYAHLNRYAAGLKDGSALRRGETIAFVGSTGNVTPGNPHLHFAIWQIDDTAHFWTGRDINPYSILRN